MDADLNSLLMKFEFGMDLSMESARFWRIISVTWNNVDLFDTHTSKYFLLVPIYIKNVSVISFFMHVPL